MKSKIFIGVDPGFKGGITVLEEGKDPVVYNLPILVTNVKGKKKTKYDVEQIVSILKPFAKKKVTFALERVGVRPMEGTVSSFNFGQGFGILQGMAIALGFNLIIISPVTWKNHFPKLETQEMIDLRAKIKTLESNNKLEKDKKIKVLNRKEVEKLGRELKGMAKDQARALAQKTYPALSDRFDRKADDGVAESVFIALYARSI